MTALTIGRLSADVERSVDLARVDRMQRRLAETDLHDRQAGSHGLAGEWCVSRIDLLLPLRADELDVSAGTRWADQIAAAIRDLIPDGHTVLHFRTRGQALADLVDRVLTGDTERTWAWRQLGLLPAGGPDPAGDPAGAVISALGSEPGLARALIPDLARRHRFDRLDQVLGETGWLELAVALDLPSTKRSPMALPRSAAAQAVLAESIVIGAALRLSARSADRRIPVWAALAVAEVCPGRPALVPLVAQLLRAGAASHLRPEPVEGSSSDESSHLRPEPVEGSSPDESSHLRPEPVEGSSPDESILRTSTGSAHVDSHSDASSLRASTSSAHDDSHSDASSLRASTGSAHVDSSLRASTSSAHVHMRPEPVEGQTSQLSTPNPALTSWAGLLYLLNTAEAAGVPELAEVETRLTGRTTRWIMHALAQRLVPVSAGDPAALALAGLPPDAEAPTGPDPTEAEEAALTTYAERWATLTLDQLAADGQLWAIARRPARIVADPGWLEVEFDLDDVDIAIRRAGLDLDPGWLDWLGVVMRFRYV